MKVTVMTCGFKVKERNIVAGYEGKAGLVRFLYAGGMRLLVTVTRSYYFSSLRPSIRIYRRPDVLFEVASLSSTLKKSRAFGLTARLFLGLWCYRSV
ncbi:hypothetical protein NDU88_008416 [Pleurodeles waltl]|uniref:Uncharacterized protein n=1 Tax=Pleurodeles waltl TaxID=8319 RepID=A0AAV7RVM8_PLEWA|nr:hypothetical protein NDU88_008416 [Pleurodeles waltl]